MAHFARIDENNIVTDVQVISNDLEHRGEDFLSNELGLGGRWIQTSYNGNIRKRFAGVGFTYNEEADVFVSPQPFGSWTLDADFNWQPPVEIPEGEWFWDEESLEWKEI
jgi:hypothetical protein